ncbi:hypothetical protein AsAng_0058580 [Aureispira anguillae]|uniref:Uncharacterized protein n=1 Tax=Aureispira anguillae TaxID=2864201 RepID=A0A915YLE0_9BACT|nr:hypothetical protein AsAng_0058580 [Aureispira anguillae]
MISCLDSQIQLRATKTNLVENNNYKTVVLHLL